MPTKLPDRLGRCGREPGRLSLRRLLSRLSPTVDFTQLCLTVQLTDAEVAEQLRYPYQ
jgi:hypothetical protein